MSNIRNIDVAGRARMLKALGNPHRLDVILRLVACCGPNASCQGTMEEVGRCVGELTADLDLAPSTISHHLKELREAGLVVMERRGQKVDCRLNGPALRDLAEFFTAVSAGRVGGVPEVSR